MNKFARWAAYSAAGLTGIVLLSASTIYGVSAYRLGTAYEARPERLVAPTAEQRADAARQARILGCVSCHGEGLKGNLMVEVPNVVRVHAPNLTEVAARATDQELSAAIRQGIGTDGRGLFVMPSGMYSRLGDGEVAALIGWIRSLPRAEGGTDGFSAGPVGRFAIAAGKLRPVPAKLVEFSTQAPIDLGEAHAAGRRLAANTCSECHGPALFGGPTEEGTVTPDLSIAGAYDYEQFRTLMRTGEAPHGRDLGLMKKVARDDFSRFTDAELAALHGYLEARAAKLAN